LNIHTSDLVFGSLLSYTPYPDPESDEMKRSRLLMLALKEDRFVDNPPILMSQWIANEVASEMASLPFSSFFKPDSILVPVPKSSLMLADSLWVPKRIADALFRKGLASAVAPCLVRSKAVRKSAFSPAYERPTPAVHYDSLDVQGSLSSVENIVLVDDVVTRGSTLMGAANKLLDVLPDAKIDAFAAIRAMSNSSEFNSWHDPVIGLITLRPGGDTLRRP
jgi:predicted amidophosphoribosyltransferase